ncbi:Gcp2p [Stylosanthes scabra]|uniref:N(6)-L-threonylcarbamoyladenine synthase n=1 Tax=Stylosanthes scabra TaxID=79078 RepID=A0ABU6RBA7_9FABA|nr:Gcp2p [Stylosanthes scabra]
MAKKREEGLLVVAAATPSCCHRRSFLCRRRASLPSRRHRVIIVGEQRKRERERTTRRGRQRVASVSLPAPLFKAEIVANILACKGEDTTGKANNIKVGVVTLDITFLSNQRHIYITPSDHCFLPRETAYDHLHHVLPLPKSALENANVTPHDINCIYYTKDPVMGAPLQVSAIIVRLLSQLWKKPIVAVNHCITHIKISRIEL